MNTDYDKITFEKQVIDKEIFEIAQAADLAGLGRELYNAKRNDAGVISANATRKAQQNTVTKIVNHAHYLAVRVEELRVSREFRNTLIG